MLGQAGSVRVGVVLPANDRQWPCRGRSPRHRCARPSGRFLAGTVLNLVKVNGAVVTGRHRDGLAIADDGDPDTGVSVDDVSRQNGDLLQEVVESPGGELQLVPTLHQIGGLGLAVRGHAGRPCQRRAICVTEGSPPMSRVRSSSEATGTSSLA